MHTRQQVSGSLMSQNFENSIPPITEADAQSISVTIRLPLDIATELRQHAGQHGQNPSQVMSNALRQYFGSSHSKARSAISISAEDWQRVITRLATLESLLPKVEQLEQTVAALENERSIASIESAPSELSQLAPIEPSGSASSTADQCPKCSNQLGPPLKASGRQVCSKCGWTNKPRQAASQVHPVDLSTDELQRMLNQAADESLANMKPTKSQNSKPPGSGPSFPFFRR